MSEDSTKREGPEDGSSAHTRGAHSETEGLGLLLDAVRDYAIFQLDPEGRIRTWNAAAQRMK
jgi:PAS domain-containing protein